MKMVAKWKGAKAESIRGSGYLILIVDSEGFRVLYFSAGKIKFSKVDISFLAASSFFQPLLNPLRKTPCKTVSSQLLSAARMRKSLANLRPVRNPGGGKVVSY